MGITAKQGNVRVSDAAQPAGNLVHLGEAPVDGLVENAPGLREFNGTMPADEEGDAESLLKLSHGTADRGLGQFQFACGSREGDMAGGDLKDEEVLSGDRDFPQFLHLQYAMALQVGLIQYRGR